MLGCCAQAFADVAQHPGNAGRGHGVKRPSFEYAFDFGNAVVEAQSCYVLEFVFLQHFPDQHIVSYVRLGPIVRTC